MVSRLDLTPDAMAPVRYLKVETVGVLRMMSGDGGGDGRERPAKDHSSQPAGQPIVHPSAARAQAGEDDQFREAYRQRLSCDAPEVFHRAFT